MLAMMLAGTAAGTDKTNVLKGMASRLSFSAYADVESAYWARGVIVDKNPYSAQFVNVEANLSPYGRIGGYAWSVSSMSRTGQDACRQNFYNEVDYCAYYGYSLDIVRDWALDTSIGPKWVTLPGYHPHATTMDELDLRQSLNNPYLTPYYLMRRFVHPTDMCYWDVGVTRSWDLMERLTMSITAFAEFGNSRHLMAQYGHHPSGDGHFTNGLMALNLLVRIDYALTDAIGIYAFVHQFNTANEDARAALDADLRPESLKDLTMFGVGITVKF